MLCGCNFIGFERSAAGEKKLQAFSTLKSGFLPETFSIATEAEIETATEKAIGAFGKYKQVSSVQRARFLETIAEEITAIGDELVQRAILETGLTGARLMGERARTISQLRLFADVLREGSWVEAVVDTALPERNPLPRADLRRMLQPIGPVVVFAASNFPFAFSTAGGDTASALAAGCPVIIKAHSSHLGTNELVAKAIIAAAQKCNMPDGVFSSLIGEGATLGQTLAKHPSVKAIGFTGSYRAGMALLKTSVNERAAPIPVYAEMSSINPVLLLPEKNATDSDNIAAQLAGSICLGAGQFCTNPGLLFVLEGNHINALIQKLTALVQAAPEATMLNQTISKSYYEGRKKLLQEQGVECLFSGDDYSHSFKGSTTLAQVRALDFINNSRLQDEVFGPASLIVRCRNEQELFQAIQSLHGQLTGTVMATNNDLAKYAGCIDALKEKVGRIIYNGVPTGVEVSHAMVHGGPFPATTDARATSVGAEAIKRFVRPVCYQDCPDAFLPDALKNSNPLQILRKVNGTFSKTHIGKRESSWSSL